MLHPVDLEYVSVTFMRKIQTKCIPHLQLVVTEKIHPFAVTDKIKKIPNAIVS